MTDRDLLEDVRRVQRETGALCDRNYHIHGHYGRSTVLRHFGSWAQAAALAGVPYAPQRTFRQRNGKYVTRDMIAADLQRLYAGLRRPLILADLRRHARHAVKTIYVKFGSTAAACAYAQVPYRRHGKQAQAGHCPTCHCTEDAP